MSTRLSGVRFFALGESWRTAFLSGKSVPEIAIEVKQNPQTISRAIWLARIPDSVKQEILAYPELFSRKVLIDTFAAKRKQCEKDNFKKLRIEVKKMIELGQGTKPNLNIMKKKSVLKKRKVIKTDPRLELNEAIKFENLIKSKINLHCRISFNKQGQGELRVFFENKEELNILIQKISST
ncbi:hypothetical protein QEJ31_07710 [Pigmentibacter sp. JX0631]|uniref:hypothetical protein n=1 Tax=Pigmentibacter sp. JX0631 TaxID=2976982 RepID=UPI002469395B|nr:hypothetical protein [Pigmentibacter sp. JX0631]WGL61474.1 hypothetical protein QEJ31_07710 [Pigmentibacter sp. JX0631]